MKQAKFRVKFGGLDKNPSLDICSKIVLVF